ncbi:hypothetical protein T440DRAFT_260676 [Plenodomus tracheiphilus IPT5]|uniref:Uncharacterized protein n=1 Tax=Plenodomus tracheiphilus IPT5 TaxID=1408161 RepID=A0A6A7AS71_9PLEO|nr:hypothetical protein T440DRAFT_260676 [Plenodomus tracheiphilus IPT5]
MQAAEHAPLHALPEEEWVNIHDFRQGTMLVEIQMSPCDCKVCKSQYRSRKEQMYDVFSYTETLDDTQTIALLCGYIHQMERDRDYISKTLEQYGNQLSEWWRRKRPSGRKAFLEQVVPQLPTTKETFLDYRSWLFLSEERQLVSDVDSVIQERAAERRKLRLAFLLPYLNIPMLAIDAYPLLALLEVRGTSRFEDWALFDSEKLTVCWASGALATTYNPGCVVLYGPRYGELRPWSRDEAHRRDVLGFPRAQLILEAQSTLLSILRQALIQAVERFGPTQSEGKNELVNYLHDYRTTARDHTPWSSYIQQPFDAPPTLDFGALISEAQVRLDDINDHLWLLQTEPAYLRRYLGMLGQMTMVGLYKKKDWGSEMLVLELKVHAESAWFWQDVLAELNHVKGIYERFRDSVGAGTPMPAKLTKALGALGALLSHGINHGARQLTALMHERPAFSGMYDRIHDPTTKSIVWKLKHGPDRPDKATESTTHRLWWCLGNLLGDPDLPNRMPFAELLDVLDDHLSSSSAKERARLDEVLYDRLSDHTSLVKIYENLNLHRPSIPKREVEDCKKEDGQVWKRIGLFERDRPIGSIAGAISALRAFEESPIPAGGKNRAWLQDFENSHAALKAFWSSIHTLYKSHYDRNGFSEHETKDLMPVLEFWQSTAYQDSIAKKRQKILSDLDRQATAAEASLFAPFASSEPPTVSTRKSRKSKVKTRSQPAEQIIAPEVLKTESEVPAVTVKVSKRAHSVFKHMFPDTNEERFSQINCDAFIHSMQDAGFSISNGGGSIIIFERGNGKIIFHRPHPIPKIDPIMLQSFGRRLNKHFGWERDTFSLVDRAVVA